jgi:hypothetical protein
MGEPTSRGQVSEDGERKAQTLPVSVFCHLISDTKYLIPEYIGVQKLTQGTETSQYLEERTSTETPLVVASERGPGQWRLQGEPERFGTIGHSG